MKKRILLSLVSFFAMTAMWASLTDAYQIYLSGDNGKAGENATLTLNLKNRNAIAKWSTTVVLPEGVTYVDGTAALVPNRIPVEEYSDIVVTTNADGSVTLTWEAPEGVALTNTDGAIATIEVAIAADVTPGVYTAKVTGTLLVESDGLSTRNDVDREFSWTIEEGETGLEGDVNDDGLVDVVDYQYVLNLMSEDVYEAKADFNDDGLVDNVDAQFVLNIMADAAE